MNQIATKLFFLSMAPFLVIDIFSAAHQSKPAPTIGLLIMATGKYTVFLKDLMESADAYFLPGYARTYFIFTDGTVSQTPNVVRIEQKRLGWPHDTMMRFSVYLKAASYFENIDYLFACDADMLFVNTVGNEILGQRVATRHPGFSMPEQRRDDYERNAASTACVRDGEGVYYFAGGFYGGTTTEFLTLASVCAEHINQDLAHNIIAKWHDESHLNRYFIDNPPTVILSPSYCYPEFWNLPFKPCLLALSKDHKEFQSAL
jgi:histo-blood group ABO system transferase